MEHAPRERRSEFRFYEELNDFLPEDLRKRAFWYSFKGTPAVKDAIEAIGVPHTEVDLVLIDGTSGGFDAVLEGGERVAVYPAFERLDISPLNRLRPEPLREIRFIADAHLGKLARYLRMLGFDASYDHALDDATVIGRARRECRIILTRDVGILKHGDVTHGYWVRSTAPRAQLTEVVAALDLAGRMDPFTRCMVCNEALDPVRVDDVKDRIPSDVTCRFDEVARCSNCGRIYWRGSHYERMKHLIASLT